MNGPGHYREAEKLLKQADECGEYDSPAFRDLSARAQVHATLALAAATALGTAADGVSLGAYTDRLCAESDGWVKALGKAP